MKIVILGAIALLGAQSDKTETFGSWSVRTISDPMTDATRGIGATEGNNDMTVVVKCDSNGNDTVYISIISKQYLGGTSRNSYRSIGFRIDGAPAESISGYYDGRTANLLKLKDGTEGGRFLKRLANATKLTLQLSDFDYRSYAAVIDVTGAKTAIARVATICRDQATIATINS